jgi:hypothetical protein
VGRGKWTCLGAIALALALPVANADAADPAWTQRALDFQYELGADSPFKNSTWIGTHNSFNSTAEMGQTLSVQDANQQIDLVAQLDTGMRSLELDVHRFPDIPGAAPKVCHARGHDQLHFGCTIEKGFAVVLGEIAAWLREPGNGREVILLYVEDHMDDATGYGDGAAAVNAQLGSLLFKPPAAGCTEVPQDLTRGDVLAAGAQVVIVSDCGEGTAWPAVAFNWDSHVEDRPVDYEDFPDCGPDYTREVYDERFVRYYEDSTALTNQVGPPTGIATPDDGITPETAAAMARCGVDLIGLDQLSGPSDPRLEALVWSWAPDEPAPPSAAKRPRCAVQFASPAFPFGRWRDVRCSARRRAACLTPDGDWLLIRKALKHRRARARCKLRDARLTTPRTGFQAQQLRLAMKAAGTRRAWLGLKRSGSAWRP